VKPDFAEEVAAHMERAQQALQAARTLCDAGLFDDVASRAYYAAFHAAAAVLMARELTYKKHAAIIGAVHKELVHTGAVTAETGKHLTWLFELRSVGDYGEIIHVDEGQARLAVSRAEGLIHVFQELMRTS